MARSVNINTALIDPASLSPFWSPINVVLVLVCYIKALLFCKFISWKEDKKNEYPS